MKNLQDLRVLIVDDEKFIRVTVKAMLRVIGRFTIAEAGDGKEALTQVARFRPDVVLCDVNMEPMGGLAFVEQLRSHADDAKRSTKIIMLTVNTQETTVLDAVRLKVDGYLVKPISPKRLEDRLRALFKDRAA